MRRPGRERQCHTIELDRPAQSRICIDVLPNPRRRLWCNGLDVIRIGQIGANGFGHQFAGNILVAIAQVLRTRQVGGSLLARVQGLVELTQFCVEAVVGI